MLPALLALLGGGGAAGALGGLLGGGAAAAPALGGSLLSTPMAATTGLGELGTGLNLSSGANQVGGFAAPQGLSSGLAGYQPYDLLKGNAPTAQGNSGLSLSFGNGGGGAESPSGQAPSLQATNLGRGYQRRFPTQVGFY